MGDGQLNCGAQQRNWCFFVGSLGPAAFVTEGAFAFFPGVVIGIHIDFIKREIEGLLWRHRDSKQQPKTKENTLVSVSQKRKSFPVIYWFTFNSFHKQWPGTLNKLSFALPFWISQWRWEAMKQARVPTYMTSPGMTQPPRQWFTEVPWCSGDNRTSTPKHTHAHTNTLILTYMAHSFFPVCALANRCRQ